MPDPSPGGPRWLVVADDFTGLHAAASRFAVSGYTVHTTTDWSAPLAGYALSAADVIGVDTASRWEHATEAYKRVRSVAEAFKEAGGQYLYKQNDSTLRGNLGPELQALHDAFAGETILYCPACPSAGRQTICGKQLMHGKVLTPVVPDGTEGLVTLQDWLSHGSNLSSVSLGMRPLSVDDAPAFLKGRQEDVVIVDASTDAQLDALARAGIDAGYRLFAGAIDLAKSLAETCRNSESLPTLTVVGSFEQRTRLQVRHLLNTRRLTVVRSEPHDHAAAVTLVRSALERGDDVLLLAQGLMDGATSGLDDELVGPSATQARSRIEGLKQVVCSVLMQTPPPLGGIVVTGGDTAHAIVREVLGATRFRIVGEVFAAGVALVPHDGIVPGLPIITKSGSWGPDDALTQALDYLIALDLG